MGRQAFGGVTITTYPVEGSDIDPLAQIPASAQAFCGSFGTNFGAVIGALPSAREEIKYVANNAGVITGVHASVVTPGSPTALVTIDCKVNGVSVLASPISLTNSTPARTTQNATVASASYAAGSVISMSVTPTTPGGMLGVFGWVNTAEQSQPL